MMIKEVLSICPVCSRELEVSNSQRVEYPNNLPRGESFRSQSIIFCDSCGVGIAYPKLGEEQLSKFYSESGYWKRYKVEILLPRKFPGHYALAMARWKTIKPHIKQNLNNKPISILDIGAGHGFMGRVIAGDKEIFLDNYCVIEKDSILKESLKNTWDKYFPQTKFEVADSLEVIKRQFNLIILSNILEHLNNPNNMLKKAVEKLANGGFVFIDVPNQDYLFKQDVFPHSIFFNVFSLETFLKKGGLKAKFMNCYGHNMKYSPINYRNSNKLSVLLMKILYKTRHFTPALFSAAIFGRHLGVDVLNNSGTWIRTLAQKSVE